MSKPIRVIVVDDHPIVRSGIVGMLSLEPDFDVVGEANNGAEAVALVTELNPDVVLMDLRMPGMDGVEATRAIIGSNKIPPRILVVTTYDTDADILRAVEAGASGYLLKDTPIDTLLDGVRAAARGETVLAPDIAMRLVGSMRTPAERLTGRELEVLTEVADGLTNAAIAMKLHISEATVKTHLLRINNKLGVDNRTEAVTEARHRGWIS
jgi:DNA-binding NarL/FixJ family response regulator